MTYSVLPLAALVACTCVHVCSRSLGGLRRNSMSVLTTETVMAIQSAEQQTHLTSHQTIVRQNSIHLTIIHWTIVLQTRLCGLSFAEQHSLDRHHSPDTVHHASFTFIRRRSVTVFLSDTIRQTGAALFSSLPLPLPLPLLLHANAAVNIMHGISSDTI